MGKILDYSNLGAAPADNDLLFMGDYSADASNPTTMRLAISDLNKKRNIDAADTNGLMLRDNDGSTFGIMIHDGGMWALAWVLLRLRAHICRLEVLAMQILL